MRPVIISLLVLNAFGCIQAGQKEKHSMQMEVELKREDTNSYTISWYDTLGKYHKLNKYSRPYHIECAIMNGKDTAGYYNGLPDPSTWTSFGSRDSIVQVFFSIQANPYSEMPPDQRKEYPDIRCEFLPVQLSTKHHLEERILLLLKEK